MRVFIVNLAERKGNRLMIDKIDELRNAFRYVNQRIYFHINTYAHLIALVGIKRF